MLRGSPPALIVAIGAWLRADISAVDKRIDQLNGEINKRIDHVSRKLGDLRERMARLEGALEGFLAGRRARDAA